VCQRRGTCTVKYVTGMQKGTVPGQQTRWLKEGISNDGRHFVRKAWAGIGGEVKSKISNWEEVDYWNSHYLHPKSPFMLWL
jgi:hypothetical protein